MRKGEKAVKDKGSHREGAHEESEHNRGGVSNIGVAQEEMDGSLDDGETVEIV